MDNPKHSVRIFLSSTFQDLHTEREALVKDAFVKLRHHSLERGAHLSIVDLRWGITREQAQQNRVVDICLRMIDECRPFFIGIIGQRYGWIPDRFNRQLLRQRPWIEKWPGASLTELEIRHGALNHTSREVKCLFYIRSARYLETVPAAERHLFVDDDREARKRLEKLKDKIHASEFTTKIFQTPAELAHLVTVDVAEMLEGALSAAPPSRSKRSPHYIEIMNNPKETRRVQTDLLAYWRSRNMVVNRGKEGRPSHLYI